MLWVFTSIHSYVRGIVCLLKTCGRHRNLLLLQICEFYDDVQHFSYGKVGCIMSILGLSVYHSQCSWNTFAFYHWFVKYQIYLLCPFFMFFSHCFFLSSLASYFSFFLFSFLEIKLSMFYISLQMEFSLRFP